MSQTNATASDLRGGPAMSTPETLTGIFFEPGATFEALRERPRFLVAALIVVALSTLVTVLLFQKVNYEEVVRRAIESNPRTEQMSPEQKEQAIAMQTGPVAKSLVYVVPLLATAITLAAGGALYLLGALLMGGRLSYKQAVSVWAYSSFPPAVLGTLLAIVMVFLKPAEDIDLNQSGAGLVVTNLGALVGEGTSPVLRAALSSFDLFTFYGMFLAALGLRKVGKLSTGSAWAVVIGLWLLWVLLRVGWAAAFGA
jgi:hypothetical protein